MFPDKCFFIESTVIMWIIWCRRNAFLFRIFRTRRTWDWGRWIIFWLMGCVCKLMIKGQEQEIGPAVKMVVDVAWKRDATQGAVAWCSIGEGGFVRNEGVCTYDGSVGGVLCACMGEGEKLGCDSCLLG